MRRLRFLIPSLAAAGFAGHDASALPLVPQDAPPASGDQPTLFDLFRQGHAVTLAQHRSHSSHSSHSSHRSGSGGHYSHTSHRSSTGGYGSPSYTPAPVYSPAPVYTPQPAYTPPPAYTPTRSAPRARVYTPRARSTEPEPRPPETAGQDVTTGSEVAPGAADPKLPALSGRTKRFEQIVKRVQIALLARGFYKGPVDGIVSPALQASIRAFQTDSSLPVTGTITTALLDTLRIASE